MKLRTWLLTRTALSSGLILSIGMGAVFAADLPVIVPVVVAPPPAPPVRLPAVSAVNFKIDIAGGRISPPLLGQTGPGWRAQAAISLPIGQQLGLQIDGAYARILGLPAWHAAAHAFYRDPTQALLGAYASWDIWGGLTRYRVAGEAELYLGRISLEGMAGYEFGTVPNGWFGTIDLAFYPTDNFRLDVGFQRNAFGNAVTAGAELQFMQRGDMAATVFFDGAFGLGGGGYQRLLGGLRFYFGPADTLIDRHRQDDPRINTDEMGCGAIAADGQQNPPNAPCAPQSPPPPAPPPPPPPPPLVDG